MATIVQISTAAQNAGLAAIIALINGGAGPGQLIIGKGTMPARGVATPSGDVLGTVVLDDPAYGAPSAGSAAMADLDPDVWDADGTAAWCRFVDSDGNTVVQGNVTNSAGDGFLKLSSTTAVDGSPFDITGFTLTLPSGE